MVSSRQFRTWLAGARAWSPAERAAGAAAALAGAGLLAWAWRLWPEWRTNPELSHGFFAVPMVALLWRRAREEAAGSRGLGARAQGAVVAVAGLGLLGAALLATAYAVALGWSSGPALVLLSGAAACAVALAAALAAGREARWIAAGWPALVMVAAVALSGPLPPGSYARLTMGLREAITGGVVETLRLFGVPAMRAGTVINLGNTAVGVEEACSGVRSLVSCVLAGLVLSALLTRATWRRAVLVLAAGPLALLANFARSLALTVLARNGVDIAGAWHDGLGYAVLGVTTGLLAWLAFALEEGPAGGGGRREAEGGGRGGGARAASAAALACLALAAGWLGYVAARSEGGAGPGKAPELARLIPAEAPDGGWSVSTRADIGRFAGTLHTEHLLERTYLRAEADGRRTQVTVYAAWWPAGATSVSQVASHTPEACWPGAGWEMQAGAGGRASLPLPGGGEVGEAEERVFRRGDYPQRVWFWHLVAGAPMRAFDAHSWRDQLGIFLEHGVRRDGAQAFVRISSNREWSELAGEPLVREVLRGFAELGVPARAGAGDALPSR